MKQKISRESIKANLYDEINIVVDHIGLTDGDILEKSSKIDGLIKGENFKKYIAPLSYEEIEEYATRQERELSLAAKRNSIEEDNSIRYISDDDLVEIVIYRNFSKIRLSYGQNVKHKLNDYFSILKSIVECLSLDKEFYKIQTVYLQKKNQIFSKSLYQLFRCFKRNMFGTFMHGASEESYALNIVQIKENFWYEDLEFDVLKSIHNGLDDETKKEIYQGQLYITGRYDAAPIDEIDIFKMLVRINDKIFDVFQRYLTEGFLEDMKNGETSKVIGGFWV